MNTTEKLRLLLILLFTWFKSKGEREVKTLLIESIRKDLLPADRLSIEVTEVYVDAPHVVTNHNSIADAMTRIETIRDKEKLHTVHMKRGAEIIYTWKIN